MAASVRILPPELRVTHVLTVVMGVVLVSIFMIVVPVVVVFYGPEPIVMWWAAMVGGFLFVLPVWVFLAFFHWTALRRSAELSRAGQHAILAYPFSNAVFFDEVAPRPDPREYTFGDHSGWLLVTERSVDVYESEGKFCFRSRGRLVRSIPRDMVRVSQRIVVARGHAFSRLYLKTARRVSWRCPVDPPRGDKREGSSGRVH